MIIKCGWCGCDMGEKPPYEDKDETTGICRKCLRRNFPDVAEKVEATGYYDDIPEGGDTLCSGSRPATSP